jgi:ribosomal protein L11 methyltransferase
VSPDRLEEARAVMVEVFPGGFEERDVEDGVDLAAYVDDLEVSSRLEMLGPVCTRDVEPGWEDRWREFHRGWRVGTLWVGPPWEEAPAGSLDVVIDPGRAFGTGAHATTRLCLELLTTLPPTALLDIGCGSGVLAIAAAKLGFSPVHAVDNDPLAVEATAANANANGVDVHVFELDALSAVLPDAATIVANVTLGSVTTLLARGVRATVVTSGYLAQDRVEASAFESMLRRERDGWAADMWIPVPE